jgi:hypothetical protein
MRIVRLLGALLALSPALSLADVTVPDTTAGHALSAWLDAFNSGDRARMESFNQTWSRGAKTDGDMQWIEEVGGYDLLDVYTNDQSYILFRLKVRSTGGEEIGKIRLSSIAPPVIAQLGSGGVPTGSRFAPVTFDDKTRGKLLDGIAKLLDEAYVLPAVGKKMAVALRKRKASPDYRELHDGKDLAAKITQDLRDVGHDKHLEVRFSYVVQLADLNGNNPVEEARWLAAVNCGFTKAEHLRPNIGYLKMDGFMNATICGSTASAAMNFVADSDALILDLRDNHGGGGGMVEYLASYLFAGRTHLDDMYSRTTGVTTETWTLPYVPGRKFIDKPMFVLTSNGTFSAAEYLANVLRNLKRATLVGETTGGGAYTVETRRLDDHFSLRLPTGLPITKTDWEGVGLEPDVKVSADQALDAALKIAVEVVNIKNASNSPAGR